MLGSTEYVQRNDIQAEITKFDLLADVATGTNEFHGSLPFTFIVSSGLCRAATAFSVCVGFAFGHCSRMRPGTVGRISMTAAECAFIRLRGVAC